MTENTCDNQWMRRALRLARRGCGLCSPNPMVGAVVVRDGVAVGEGYHHRVGEPHAEPNALDAAGDAAQGATLYVTLEPCSTWGRTPPCTQRIIRAGVRRVVIGTLDANPAHKGAAISILQHAGITVDCGILDTECRALNEAFFWWITTRKPFVILKMAMTLDGKIATEGGDSKWITGEPARRMVQSMRRRADAVMVGGATVLADQPSLMVRQPAHWPRQPRRLVWSSMSKLPPSTRMLSDGGPAPELLKPQTTLEWQAVLTRLGAENVSTLLLEGGGELAAAALKAGIVNQVAFFVAPKILCGRNSRPVVGGDNPVSLSSAISLYNMNARKIGDDILLTGYINNN